MAGQLCMGCVPGHQAGLSALVACLNTAPGGCSARTARLTSAPAVGATSLGDRGQTKANRRDRRAVSTQQQASSAAYAAPEWVDSSRYVSTQQALSDPVHSWAAGGAIEAR